MSRGIARFIGSVAFAACLVAGSSRAADEIDVLEPLVVARVGEARTASLSAAQEAVVFSPMPGRPWKEYVQLHPAVLPAESLAAYAREALEHTAGMPPKVEKPKKATSGSPKKAAKAPK